MEEANLISRAAVQHLALFVPWQKFESETSRDVDVIWAEHKTALKPRLAFVVDNIQLLRRSAEDARKDAKQWAALSGGDTTITGDMDPGSIEDNDTLDLATDSGHAADVGHLISVFAAATEADQITKDSPSVERALGPLYRFQNEMRQDDPPEPVDHQAGQQSSSISASLDEAIQLLGKKQVAAVRKQQHKLSTERVKAIKGLQGMVTENSEGRNAVVQNLLNGFGEDDVDITPADSDGVANHDGEPSMNIAFGPSTTYLDVARRLSERFTLNERQSASLRIIGNQMDQLQRDGDAPPPLYHYLGGEGGTGKSRVIEAIVSLFAAKGISHRLLVTATSGTAAANINGVTIHSACSMSMSESNETKAFSLGKVDGRERAEWQEKLMLIIDEVSMLGSKTFSIAEDQLRKLRGIEKDFGGLPIVMLCGDFHQFPPIMDRSIILPPKLPTPSAGSKKMQGTHEQNRGHELWKKFKTVVILKEQVRAAEDPELRRLLTRIREGICDQSDVDLLNDRCYQENRRIPWETGITTVTPLNRNRWNLNIEATLSFHEQHNRPLRIFLSEHTWGECRPTGEEVRKWMHMGDDSKAVVPGIFMFVQGMPVVVNKNTHLGLKVTNGQVYEAVGVVIDDRYPGFPVSDQITLHFGPPAGLLLKSDSTESFNFTDIPTGTILLTAIAIRLSCDPKRRWQTIPVQRKGLPCTAAFACTDYKVQGKTLDSVALDISGNRLRNGETGRCDPYSVYVQLSRSRSLRNVVLLSQAREQDFIGNKVPDEMAQAERMLENLSEETLQAARGL
jgi:hypothetical protein